MGKCYSFIGCLVVVLVSSKALALPAVAAYGTDLSGNLNIIDLTSGASTLVGNTGQSFLEGLALAPDGRLFATDSSGLLYQLNTTTGAATSIGSTGLGNIEGLDFQGNTLLCTNFDSTPTVYSINLTTAAVTLVHSASTDTGVVRAMAVSDSNHVLIRTDSPGEDILQQMDLTTGATTILGTINANSNGSNYVTGLDFASDGNFYGVNLNGDVLRINPTNAATTLMGNTPNESWLDMTAIPEPASLGLLILPIMALRRHRMDF